MNVRKILDTTMLKAIHAQESREAAGKKAQAIVEDLRATKMARQPALAPSRQPQPAPTARALPPKLVDQRGPFWVPIRGPIPTPIDT